MNLVDGVLAADPRAVARAVSTVENQAPEARALLERLRPNCGRAYRIGVTGSSGAGKSTLVDRLISGFRSAGESVAVLAVDPTSAHSGGALLGDRIRMQTHAADPGVFIRSMATRGRLGGLARASRDAATVFDAAGFDVIVLETIGVGQDEIEIADVADLSILVTVPDAGDDVQALKAGVMEIADIFVVNKADREGADRAVAGIEMLLSLDETASRPPPPVLSVVATTGAGIPDLMAAIGRHRQAPGARIVQRSANPAGRDMADPPRASIDHVGIALSDGSGLLAFLKDNLGLSAGEAADLDAHSVRVRFVPAGETSLEVIEPTSETSPVARFLKKRGPGLHHVALRVRDLDATIASLQARGVRLIDQVARPGAHGTRVAFLHPSSAEGVLIELVEPGRRR